MRRLSTKDLMKLFLEKVSQTFQKAFPKNGAFAPFLTKVFGQAFFKKLVGVGKVHGFNYFSTAWAFKMRLVIAEKPSVGKSTVSVLGEAAIFQIFTSWT